MLSCAGVSHAQGDGGEERLLDVKLVPAVGRTAREFVPRGWTVQEESAGDLNGDQRPDVVLKLVEDLPEERDGAPNERYRALVILFKRADGGFELAGTNTRLLLCTGCGGMLGMPGGGVLAIDRRGTLTISQLSGSREGTETTHRFRYDPRARRFTLIGLDVNNFDRLTGDSQKQSSNYLTGVKITQVYRPNKRRDDTELVSTRRSRVPATRPYLEDVAYDYRP